MRSLADCHLYGILDLGYVASTEAEGVTSELLQGGIDILQLRAKSTPAEEIAALAERLLPLTEKAGVPFIINDHPEIAREVGAQGVHLGQDDGGLEEAREIAGDNCLIGRSTHSLDQALEAQREGADYIGFGPLFATPTKPDYEPIGLHDIARAHELVRLPVFCIGGIHAKNLASVLDKGARRVVIVSGILKARDRTAYVMDCRKIMANPAT